MRRVSAVFMLLASLSMSAQNGPVGVLKLLPAPADSPLHDSKMAAPFGLHNISLCQTYDHYLHDIPVSTDAGPYLRKILVELKSAPARSSQEEIARGKK